ncbi:hypothetical protein AKJ09_10209 [Labilithrix luteola]|uniref:Uncharacterized protein n=1 Tax=Labilithrix luteola TaxID=1391654 RepID=A0A0K1QCN8_9BACT|nr:hypothetical protein AKJ09_10209 [Labilithrix luteola]
MWFRLYAATMALAFGAVVVAGFLVHPAGGVPPTLVATPFVVLFGVATFVPMKPWAWTLGFIAIACGLPSCTCLAAFPLLLRWNRPEVKAAFARI